MGRRWSVFADPFRVEPDQSGLVPNPAPNGWHQGPISKAAKANVSSCGLLVSQRFSGSAFFLRRTARFPLASGPKGAAHWFRCLRCLPGVSSRLNTGHFFPDLQMVTGFAVFTVLYSQNYGTRKIPASPNRPDKRPPAPFWAVMRADSAEVIPGYTVKRRIRRDALPPRRLRWAFCQPFTRART